MAVSLNSQKKYYTKDVRESYIIYKHFPIGLKKIRPDYKFVYRETVQSKLYLRLTANVKFSINSNSNDKRLCHWAPSI